MDTRDLWENQINLLTTRCKVLCDTVENLEKRIAYFENVLLTLLVALKEGGIITDSSETDENTYTFDEQ